MDTYHVQIAIRCTKCGNEFHVPRSRKRKFCSAKCSGIGVPLAERFWSKVDKHGPVPAHMPELGSCWVWTGAHSKSGYGSASTGGGGKCARAHRVAWKLVNGQFDEALDVLHKCDNVSCVNTAHLFLGTHTDNMRDMVAKGRNGQLRGEKHRSAKVSDAQVIELRGRYRIGEPIEDIARSYGITRDHARNIATWKERANIRDAVEVSLP